MARARLRERHQENLRKKLLQLKQEQGVLQTDTPIFPIVKREDDGVDDVRPGTSRDTAGHHPPHDDEDSQGSLSQDAAGPPSNEEVDPIQQAITEYNSGRYSPVLLQSSDLQPGTLLLDPTEDEERMEFARKQFQKTGTVAPLNVAEQAFEREAMKEMDNDEARFSVESLLENQTYLWSDKYRPRKPRYFNRVHTGFEWNKYNQTHYDMDNPPPKIVQGYKFNIFYPDLIDKNKTPEYFLTACKDNPDFTILRFHAGPPYEDIAFKIVNREWEYSYKKRIPVSVS